MPDKVAELLDLERSIGISERRQIHAASCADARYWRIVNPAGSPVTPACSMPTDSRFISVLPECHAMSERWTSWTILPARETT